MYVAFYRENGELSSMIGKYKTVEDAADAIEAKTEPLKDVNPYWVWIEETE